MSERIPKAQTLARFDAFAERLLKMEPVFS